jgi:D-glycero-D-manno-heptose 1,7-bisphosphate phosphatase
MVIVPTNFSAVFLDRDGIINKPIIINKKPYAPKKYNEFKFYPGIYENLQALKNNGFLIIVVTNQPDIGNGITKLKEVQLMHDKLMKTNLIDEIYMCSHNQREQCSCRKPGIKMLNDAKNKFNINMSSSWLIGDRWSDVTAAHNAGLTPIFVDYGYAETKSKLQTCINVKNLKSAVSKIIAV